MTADQIVTIVASVIAGVIAGGAAVGSYFHGYWNTERTERRKQKIDLAQELMASRYVLNANYSPSDVDARDFNRAMARIPYAFSDSPDVIQAYDRMVANKTDDTLFLLLEASLTAAGLKQYAVARTHLTKVMTVASGRKPMA